MKTTFIGLCIITSSLMLGQNIKTKKNQILFDNKEIAKYEDKKKWYTISDLDGTPLIKIKPNIYAVSSEKRIIYYEVTSPDESVYVSLYNPSKEGSISQEKKMLFDFTLGEYKLFTPDGVDKEVIRKMLESNLDVKSEIEGEHNRKEEEYKNIYQNLKDEKINFNDKGEIVVNNKNIIGSITRRRPENNSMGLVYEIFDSNGHLVGTWVKSGANELKLINNKTYVINDRKASPDFNMNMDDMTKIITGYTLENNFLFDQNKVTGLLKENSISLTESGEILKGTNFIGHIERTMHPLDDTLIYKIFNKKGDLITVWYEAGNNISVFDNNYENITNEVVLSNGKIIGISRRKGNLRIPANQDALAKLMLGLTIKNNLLNL